MSKKRKEIAARAGRKSKWKKKGFGTASPKHICVYTCLIGSSTKTLRTAGITETKDVLQKRWQDKAISWDFFTCSLQKLPSDDKLINSILGSGSLWSTLILEGKTSWNLGSQSWGKPTKFWVKKQLLKSQGCQLHVGQIESSQTSDFVRCMIRLKTWSFWNWKWDPCININQQHQSRDKSTGYSVLCIISECPQHLHLHALRNLPLWKLLTIHKKGPFGFRDVKRFRVPLQISIKRS